MPDFATRPARSSTVQAVPSRGRWLTALHRGLDVLVAFATLRDAPPAGEPRGVGVGEADDAFDPGRTESGDGRAAGARGRRADPHAAMDASHPHRRPLRAPARGRRPGAVDPSPQACTTPLALTRPPRRPDRVVEPRR